MAYVKPCLYIPPRYGEGNEKACIKCYKITPRRQKEGDGGPKANNGKPRPSIIDKELKARLLSPELAT